MEPLWLLSDHTPRHDSYEEALLDNYSTFLRTELQPAAQSANPPSSPKFEHGIWYGFPATIMTILLGPPNTPFHGPTEWPSVYKSSLGSAIVDAVQNCSYTVDFADVYVDRASQESRYVADHPTAELHEILDNLYPAARGRTSTATEVRMLSWLSLSCGAKGLFFNTVGSDRGSNIGITDPQFNHDYDYDLSGSRTPLLGWYFGNDGDPAIPLTFDNNRSHGYTDHVIGVSGSHPLRFIPIVDPLNNKRIVYKPGAGEESIADYIATNPNAYGLTDYYQLSSGAVATDYVPWLSFRSPIYPALPSGSSQLDTITNNSWGAYWQYLDHDGPSGSDCHSMWNNLFWPETSVGLRVKGGLYEGYKERWLGASTVAKDLRPIALALSKLDWLASFNFNKLAVEYTTHRDQWDAAQAISAIDLSSIVSYKLEQTNTNFLATRKHTVGYTATGDSVIDSEPSLTRGGYEIDFGNAFENREGDRRFLQLGYFDWKLQQTDPTHWFVIVVNPRSYPMWRDPYSGDIRLKDQTDASHKLLGAVDARGFSFELNSSLVNPHGKYTKFFVTNMNTGITQTNGINGAYMVHLDPRQGALLMMGPASTVVGGKGGGSVANNGRHLGAYEQSPLVSAYFETFAGSGIHLSCPKDTIDGIIRRVEGTPLDSVIDTARYARTPSIAVNSDSGTTGLVYTIDSVGPYKNQSLVLFRFGHVRSPYSYSAADTLAIEPMGGVVPVAPSIAAAARGMFWVAYRDSNNSAKITLVDSNGHTVASQRFSCGGMENTGFVSVGDVLHPLSGFGGYSISGPAPIDTCYIAFQAGIPGATQIYFLKAYQNIYNPAEIDTTGRIWAS